MQLHNHINTSGENNIGAPKMQMSNCLFYSIVIAVLSLTLLLLLKLLLLTYFPLFFCNAVLCSFS